MSPEAAYWALLTGDEAGLADKIDAWHAAGNRSVRGLFEQAPQALALLLNVPDDALAPLVALRSRVPQASRLMERLERDGVSYLSRWDRRYPRALKAALVDQAPQVLWYAGSLELLAQKPVAVFGTRDAGPEAVAFARALAIGLAGQGRPVITGMARAIERATLEAALGVDGQAIVVLGQGIARAQPDLRRLRTAIAAGRLLVLAIVAPETAWQPSLEEGRSAVAVSLAERIVLAQAGEIEGTMAAAEAARRFRRPVFIREADVEAHRSLPAAGASPLPWPAEPGELTALLVGSPERHGKDDSGQGLAAGDMPRTDGAPEQVGQEADNGIQLPHGGNDEARSVGDARDLEGAVLQYLQRNRRRATGKGALLQVFPFGEAALDHALWALIASGKVVERQHRAGARYSAVRGDAAESSGFQLSLFGQDEDG